MDLVDNFARLVAARGKPADTVARGLVSLDADEAPGGTELEFLPMCGVAALGMRASVDASARPELLGLLHECAEDLRFRVRDLVPPALSRIGLAVGASFAVELEPWMDGYFHAAAVVRALGDSSWLATFAEPELPLQRLDDAFALLRNAPRAASRYPGHKALVEALSRGASVLMPRFGARVFDLLVDWAKVKDPALREVVAANLRGTKIHSRFAMDVRRVETALSGSAKAPRDPTQIVQGTRKRGGGRRH